MRTPLFSLGRRVEILYIFVLVLGFVWCKDVLGRLSEDIRIMKESTDKAEKLVVVFYWVVTVGIMALMAIVIWSLITKFIGFVK